MDFKGVLARKPVADIVASQDSSERRLSKVLGPFSIAAMGVGAIIGAGIFVLTGTAAALYAGPAIVLSFVLVSHRLRPGRPVLRRALRVSAGVGQQLHLHLRHPG